ncbi:hypothetical protein [Candidatus Nitronereus thalassa]|uniref:Uncharacterized protein n=1 Tax=Candidatus Nitronereus thalassa TaxID=3020898 RepID=A0ABU3KAX3_9BACT|nr:hypothetical protein [Candidatus Nitronereus thalassa]MDT7043634.1 hypothetical protein [Candidatus Nitronereus thalassa]
MSEVFVIINAGLQVWGWPGTTMSQVNTVAWHELRMTVYRSLSTSSCVSLL